MSIEPTSVSKPAVREVEPTSSNFASWTSMQGRSTGGKDSPLNTLWEKAINGAQKLFGADTSASSLHENEGETEEGDDAKPARSRGGETAFTAAPSFTARRFGSFGGAAFGGNTFGSVATSRAAPDAGRPDFEAGPSSFDAPKSKPVSSAAQHERPLDRANAASAENDRQARAAAEEAAEDEGASKEKRLDAGLAKPGQKGVLAQATTAAPLSLAPQQSVSQAQQEASPLPATPPAAAPATVQPQASSPVASNAGPVSQQATPSPAPQQGTGSGKPITQVAGDASKPQLPAQTAPQVQSAAASHATPSKGGEVASATTAPAVSAQTAQSAPVAQPVAGDKAQPPASGTGVKADTPTVPAMPETAVSKPGSDAAAPVRAGIGPAQEATSAKEPASSKEGLGFDVAKAKEAVSEALSKAPATGKPGPASGTPAPASAPQQTAQPVAPPLDGAPKLGATEMGAARLGEPTVGEGKDSLSADASKREAAALAQPRPANARTALDGSSPARSVGLEGTAAEANKGGQAGIPSAKASASQVAAAASRVQPAPVQGRTAATPAQSSAPAPAGVNGVSGGAQPQANGTPVQGAQQGNPQHSDGDPAAKQEFGAAVKQASAAKGGEKPADGAQSFEAKVEAAATRRSEAAGKARQSSYVSKTAAEVKEVVAALTKSIDRLVTDKNGGMNLKINFEGGGSLKLSVSMEGGKVATSMQTDVVGLEAAIKANWSELANDWNQKGVKLTTPLFQNSEAGKDSSFENLSDFASKQDRQSEGKAGDGRGRGAGQASNSRGFPDGSADQGDASEGGAEQQRQEIISDKELKTYA